MCLCCRAPPYCAGDGQGQAPLLAPSGGHLDCPCCLNEFFPLVNSPACPLPRAPHLSLSLTPCLPQKKEFPYNLEQSLFGRELNIPMGPERKAAILRVALQQLLDCLEKCHAVGEWPGRRCAAQGGALGGCEGTACMAAGGSHAQE